MNRPVSSDFDDPKQSNFYWVLESKYDLILRALEGDGASRDEALEILAQRYPDEYAPDKDE